MKTLLFIVTLTILQNMIIFMHQNEQHKQTTLTLQMCEESQPPLAPINKLMRGDYNEF